MALRYGTVAVAGKLGRHRFVASAETAARRFRDEGFNAITVEHLTIDRRRAIASSQYPRAMPDALTRW